MPRLRLSLDWISVITALLITVLIKADLVHYIPW